MTNGNVTILGYQKPTKRRLLNWRHYLLLILLLTVGGMGGMCCWWLLFPHPRYQSHSGIDFQPIAPVKP